jgi:hypothetical protein
LSSPCAGREDGYHVAIANRSCQFFQVVDVVPVDQDDAARPKAAVVVEQVSDERLRQLAIRPVQQSRHRLAVHSRQLETLLLEQQAQQAEELNLDHHAIRCWKPA